MNLLTSLQMWPGTLLSVSSTSMMATTPLSIAKACTMKSVLDADGVEQRTWRTIANCTQLSNIMWLKGLLKVLRPPANTTHSGRP